MSEVLFRCSAIGRLMTEPKTQKEGPLSVGAKTYIRELVAQELFGVDFEISSREMQKGVVCEGDSIALLNRVRGTSLVKNTERRTDGFFTGECDLFDAPRRRGHDLKTSWSLKTFPITLADCKDKAYEYQMRAYMRLWDADEWSVDYAMVNTPEDLIGYEPASMHFVDHIPEHMRLTSWVVTRDLDIEATMVEKIKHARVYYAEVIAEFDRTHVAERMAEAREMLARLSAAPPPAPAESLEVVATIPPHSAPNAPPSDESPAQLPPAVGHSDRDLVERASYLADHVAQAFAGKFPTHPKPSVEWWAGLRLHLDLLQPMLREHMEAAEA